MDGYNRQEQIGSSEDEDQNFVRYMDEDGVIGLKEGGMELYNQGFIEEDETEQQKILGLEIGDMLEQDEEGILFPASPTDGDRSDSQSWKEQFSFSQMPEERRNQEIISIHDTDDLTFLDQPSRSITLPSALERRPPSRDQQLDMTEDEVDQGSSLGAWDGNEEENWNTQQLGLLYNGTEHERLDDYGQTLAGEDQWNNLPGSPQEDYSNISKNQGGEAIKESHSPSSPPLPSTWDTRLFGMLSLSPGIEAETLPEPSHTDSGEGSAVIPFGDHGKVSRVTKLSNQTTYLRTKSTLSPSSSTKRQNAQHSNEKKSKNSTIEQYGRGQLNYPLPDFSKVGPRVRFPRDDQGYRPPQPQRLEKQSAPTLFKSPADIVREVLLSSVEKPAQEPTIPPSVPQEFKTPQQATQLVHQLQEDYHKLLTKYAEAENTIDRLRLGAKVQLYSDPAKPSHSVQMGTVMQGSKVMEFTIHHAQVANFSAVNEDNDITKRDTGSSAPRNHSATPSDATLPGTSGSSILQGPEDSASILRSHLETLYREVDLFVGLLQGGNLTPEEQQQAVQELRGSLDVLERRYLQAQEQYRQEQRRTGYPSLELDPQRELEDAIFQLGVQLDELQERVDHSAQSNPSTDLTRSTRHLDNVPLPSAVVPVPTTQTPYPQATSPGPPGLPGTGMRTSDKEDPEEYLPQPLHYKHMQVEKDYGALLSTYSSFKSLPDALGQEQDEWPQQNPPIARPHDHENNSTGQGQFQASRSQDHARPHDHQDSSTAQGHFEASRLQDNAQARRPLGMMTPVSSHNEHAQAVNSQDHQLQTKAKRQSPRTSQQYYPKSIASQNFPPDRLSLSSSLPRLKEQSPRTPTIEFSASEESIQGSPSHKSTKNVGPLSHNESPITLKESIAQRRILSPETDSGFLGSESGRCFPLHKQRHQLSPNRREDAVATQDSSNAAVKNERRRSKNSSGNFYSTRKVLRDNRTQNNPWVGPSEASSPSLGPKSLTESESREESHTDESDSERERSNNVIGDVSSGASLLPSPTDEPTQPLRNIMESRTARNQAIHDLQKEVTQLRHHLENSLTRSPARGKLWKPTAAKKQHEADVPHFSPGLDSTIYRHRAPVNETRTVTMKTSKEDESVLPTHPACLFCMGKSGSYNAPRTGMSNDENRRHRRNKHCQHWYMSHPPPVGYVPSPPVPYSPPVIYSTPPGIYVPVEYNVTDIRSSFAVAPPPNSDIGDLYDLSYPLSQALDAAQELKITSKRMCQSLTTDLSMQRSLRGSCLF
ncbi:PREDICTED: AT-hook-containing transcription factor [Nanorana parkeri]|uniref:AT-hook-containing transcription factor n=1 Tax=Nanorana parkeri TaxID=125878 RepID=UPI000854C031|nr:PREDICTED: AT-hook-containing transcription factor [Nanorana parkeri]